MKNITISINKLAIDISIPKLTDDEIKELKDKIISILSNAL